MTIPANLDHIVVATPDLAATVADFEAATGVTPERGGVHPRSATRNHLVSFGGGAYLEIIGVDQELATPDSDTTVFGLDRVTAPTARTFAIHPSDPVAALHRGVDAGVQLGELGEGARRTEAGHLLTWRLTRPLFSEDSGVVPFVIDWGTSASPADTVRPHAELTAFTLRHPEPDVLREQLTALGTDVEVEPGQTPGLSLTITGPSGSWTLG